MLGKDHDKPYKEIREWMDEPLRYIRRSYKVYCYLEYTLFLYSNKIRTQVNIFNHRCWRHTYPEVIDQFSRTHGGKYNHFLVREVVKKHLEDDDLDMDDIMNLRQIYIKKELRKLNKTNQLTLIPKILLNFFQPIARFQGNYNFEIIKNK